jgi:hypothetical protein
MDSRFCVKAEQEKSDCVIKSPEDAVIPNFPSDSVFSASNVQVLVRQSILSVRKPVKDWKRLSQRTKAGLYKL